MHCVSQKITSELDVKLGKEARAIDATQIKDPDLLRKLKKLSNIGTAALDPETLEEFDDVVYDMAKIYNAAVVPSFMDRNKLIKLEPKVRRVMETSANAEELQHYWTEWRKATGPKMREAFLDYTDIMNEAATWVPYPVHIQAGSSVV